jgi:hypothetical protein
MPAPRQCNLGRRQHLLLPLVYTCVRVCVCVQLLMLARASLDFYKAEHHFAYAVAVQESDAESGAPYKPRAALCFRNDGESLSMPRA